MTRPGGHPGAVPSSPVADSVRLAWPGEAQAVAELQRRAWAGYPAELGDSLLAAVTLDEMTEQWRLAITRPPKADFRLLVAVADHRVVGCATTLPSTDDDAEPGRDGEIGEFLIDPPARGRGHGSRLLNACADTLRTDGFSRASVWVATTDDAVRAFLTAAGWAADGAHRELGLSEDGIRLRQVRLHTTL